EAGEHGAAQLREHADVGSASALVSYQRGTLCVGTHGCLSSWLTSYGERAITAGLSALHDGNEVTDDLSPPPKNAGNKRAGLQPCGCVGVEPTIPGSNRTL